MTVRIQTKGLDKGQLSDLKSLVDRKIEAEKALYTAQLVNNDAQRNLDQFLWTIGPDNMKNLATLESGSGNGTDN